MIPKKVLREFLNRQLPNHNELLDLSPAQLRARMRKLPQRPPIWKKLRHEQRACLIAGAEHGSFAFFLDTGVGKSLTAISLIRYFRKLDPTKRFLVLVPNEVNIGEWELEIQKHSPKTRYCLLMGSTQEKTRRLNEEKAAVYIGTYAGVYWMAATKVKDAKKKRNVLKMNRSKLRKLLKHFDGVIADESYIAQGRKSAYFKVCRQMSNACEHFFVMCATPINRDPTALWTQMFLVDRGETLGKNLGMFRHAFFRQEENPFTGFPQWVFDKRKKKYLHKLLGNRSITVEASASSLPECVLIQKRAELPQSSQALYKNERKRLLEARGDYQKSENAFIRLRQLSSGFIGYKDDQLGTRAKVELHPNPKLEMLKSLVAEVSGNHKLVIFCDFVFSGDMICRELKKLGIGHGRIYGGTKNPIAERKRFDTDDTMRCLVLQNSCGGFGLNLQIARWGVYFESPVSALMRKQTQRRVERQGTNHDKVFIVDLIINGTSDDAILNFHRDGKDLFDAVIRGKDKGFVI